MLHKDNKKNKGFTIIEVLIVLAIAGLILLIVFLAVPALQRNSRNTQIKSSASAVLGAVSEFKSNNNGRMPSTVAVAADGTVTVSDPAAGSVPATAKVQPGYAVAANATAPGATGTINIALNFKCNGNVVGAATPRATAALFKVETGAALGDQCVES